MRTFGGSPVRHDEAGRERMNWVPRRERARRGVERVQRQQAIGKGIEHTTPLVRCPGLSGVTPTKLGRQHPPRPRIDHGRAAEPHPRKPRQSGNLSGNVGFDALLEEQRRSPGTPRTGRGNIPPERRVRPARPRTAERATGERRNGQWEKCRAPVRYIVTPAASAAAITSSSRTDPPGCATAETPASSRTCSPSANGKNASDAATDPAARSPARATASFARSRPG